MPLEIFSPHSGRPVKVREQDLGRAIRDEGGRIFYVVPRSDGEGHYGSLTRQGSERDEQRYLNQDWKLADAAAREGEDSENPIEVATDTHDATGVRSSRRKWVVLLVLAAIVILGVLIVLRDKPEHGSGSDEPQIQNAVPAPEVEAEASNQPATDANPAERPLEPDGSP